MQAFADVKKLIEVKEFLSFFGWQHYSGYGSNNEIGKILKRKFGMKPGVGNRI